MATVKVEFSKTVGKIKPVHGVGQPPLVGASCRLFHYLKEAHIPYSRLHDVGGFLGGGRFVDIPNLFRDFDANPYDPASYDFAYTDILMAALVENGVEPFFRLGVTIENNSKIRPYRVFPPKDFHKWAVICEQVIRHYTEGWANGFHYDIRYWEIWNEPDNWEEIEENDCWKGTKEQFYELYDVAAKHLKKCFPHLKIGGYASCGFYALDGQGVKLANSSPRYGYFVDFFDGFIDYIKENGSPLDFFSWHSYSGIKNNIGYAAYARRRLDEAGYTATETTCNEWNSKADLRGSFEHAAITAGMLLAFQDTALDSAMFYDARCGVSTYSGMFNPLTTEPFPAYYGFKAFGELYIRGEQKALTLDTEDVYAVAADGEQGGCVMIANTTENALPLNLDLGEKKVVGCKILNEAHLYEDAPLPETLDAHTVLCVFTD